MTALAGIIQKSLSGESEVHFLLYTVPSLPSEASSTIGQLQKNKTEVMNIFSGLLSLPPPSPNSSLYGADSEATSSRSQ